MKDLTPPFDGFRANRHSQNGEDGVIAEILRRMALKGESRWCCEFGAWDGKHLSNTFYLVEQGWNAVFIEGDDKKYSDLLKTANEWRNIIPVNAFVDRFSNDKNCLDNLLASTPIPEDFDVLSIDIDSFDLDVWESLIVYTAKLIIIEINSSIPPGIFLRHSQSNNGNSFASTLKVGTLKGYTLTCHTGNLIFVRNDLMPRLGFPKYFVENPEMLFNGNWLNKAK